MNSSTVHSADGPEVGPEVDIVGWPLQARDSKTYADLLALLSPDERARGQRFVFDDDRHAYVVARGVMRRVLGDVIGQDPRLLQFTYQTNGKPVLEGGPNFNLTHSGGHALLAISKVPVVGIDLELVRTIDLSIAPRFFSVAENAALQQSTEDPLHAFFRCWTRKEAIVKALGHGLTIDTRTFDVDIRPPAQPWQRFGVRRLEAGTDASWAIFDVDYRPGFVAALAVQCGRAAPDIRIKRTEAGLPIR